MSESRLDCRGLSCPLPVIRVKDRLEGVGGTFAVVVDTEVAVENITRFLGQRGVAYALSRQEDGTLISISKQST